MLTFTSEFQAELDKGQASPRTLIDTYELYDPSYVPGATGFDPSDAIELFGPAEFSWNGNDYRREVISRGDITLNVGEKTNSVTVTFSNISRYMATLAENQVIEGCFLVIRCIAPLVTNDWRVEFVGRCEKPGDIDKKRFSLSARQDFGNINVTVPPREYSPTDPEGRLPSDPLFEGINFVAVFGTNTFPVVGPATHFFGRLLGQRDTTYRTEQWSSIDGTPYGEVIREVFGRCQMQLRAFAWADKGLYVTALMEISAGPIFAAEDIRTRTEGFSQPYNLPGPIGPVVHLGDAGGTGTNTGNTNQADLGGGSKFSHLAYIEAGFDGSKPDATDDPPVVTALVFGRIVPLPDGTGEYVAEGWTDNPVHILRFMLTHPSFVNIDPAFMEDSAFKRWADYCDEPLIDTSNDQLIAIHSDDIASAGTDFTRRRSTGIINARSMRYNFLGDTSIIPELEDGPYEEWDPLDPMLPQLPDGSFIRQKLLIKRFTANFPLTEKGRAVDVINKLLLPTFRGGLRVNKYGRYEPFSEIPADATRIRSAIAAGATSIPVLDVTPWKTGPNLLAGWILLGTGLITSEARQVSLAQYSTSGNSITLAASDTGGVTATASGATLSGGSTSTQASGTVTIAGTPAPGDTVTVTINGIEVEYTLGSDDTVETVALMLKSYINATPRLKQYIRASWDSGDSDVVTITALHGTLTVSALLKTHSGPVADPTTAPTVAAAGSGSLDAGTYYVAYADVTVIGPTALTNVASVTLTAGQKINVSSLPALPAGVIERRFYLSEEPGSENLRYHTTRTDAANFSINSLAADGADLPPSFNRSAEELVRIAMPLATNSQDVYPAWPRSTLVILNDVYLPTVLNGHKYKVATAGTTAASEPTWPTTSGGTVVDGGVTWEEIGPTVLSQTGLTRANIIKDSYKFPLGSTQSSVNVIEGEYRDAKNDHALTPFRITDKAHFAQVKKWYPKKVDYSAVDSWHQAFRLGKGELAKSREGDWFNTMATGPKGLCLEETDLIAASDDAGGHVNALTRIEELRIKPNHDVVISLARKYSTDMYSDEVESSRITIASTLKLSRARAITNLEITHDATGDYGFVFDLNPRTIEEPAEGEVEITTSLGVHKRYLPVTRGSSQAALLFSNTGGGGGLVIGDTIETPHADRNNLYAPFDIVDGSAKAISLFKMMSSALRFNCEVRWRGDNGQDIETDILSYGMMAKVGLQPLVDADDVDAIDFDLCPIMFEWSRGAKDYMIKETYKSFGVTIGSLDKVDPGYEAVGHFREGPKYSFQLIGTEYRLYRFYVANSGQAPVAIVSAPSTGFPYPLRAVMEVMGIGSRMGILNCYFSGDRYATTYSIANQIKDFGSIQEPIYGSAYQKAKFAGLPNGFATTFVAP